jgi:U4/U6.U5 tri-snRNP-associated protein 1
VNHSKVRISLGLRPLSPDPAASKPGEGKVDEEQPVDQDALAEDNYRRKREEDRRKKEEKEIKDRIAK